MVPAYLHPPYIQKNVLLFYVKIKPSSKQNGIESFDDQHVLKISLTAAPVDGKANKALIRLLSKTFHVSQSHIHIMSGETSKIKRIQVQCEELKHIPSTFASYISESY